jgi:putative phosphoesterase
LRVAVIADTHLPRGARELPDACVDELRRADLVLHAGDVVAAAVLEDLRALGPPVHAVCGNMEEPALAQALPTELVVDVEEARIGLVHVPGPAAGREARLRGRFPGCQAVVYGHTHVPQVERDEGVWILNPGSPTERRRAPEHTMLLLEVRGSEIEPTLLRLDP